MKFELRMAVYNLKNYRMEKGLEMGGERGKGKRYNYILMIFEDIY